MDGSTAQARRYYHHVINGGTLNERDVARMVEGMEAKDAEIARLTAALAEAEARSAALVAGAKAEGMREAAGIAYHVCAETRHVTLGRKAEEAILAAAAAKEPKP